MRRLKKMKAHKLGPPKGAKQNRKRIGRGDGSGHGSFSGRGIKGQKSRSGGGVRPGFEGGQLALFKALPKMRGFTNIFRIEFTEVNLDRLARFQPETEVTLGLMVLGRGELSVPLVVEAHKFSAGARRKIEAAGGSVREIA
jgi:large subunit ribosomal protein L15